MRVADETEKERAAVDRSGEPPMPPRPPRDQPGRRATIRDVAREADFALLQRCRGARLVEPVGADHLYFAAMQSGACRLTALGRHYWRMAHEGRL